MVINWLDFVSCELILKSFSEQTLPRGHLLVQVSLARLFNSCWHNYLTVAGTILHISLAQFFNSHWCNSSTDTGTNVQQSLARLFNSGWHDCSTVSGMILQQRLARLLNSRWQDCSTVAGTIVQLLLARFFNGNGQDFFFYAGRILQKWCSLLKNRAMHQEYDAWSADFACIRILNMLEFHRMYWQGSWYTSGSEYARVLNLYWIKSLKYPRETLKNKICSRYIWPGYLTIFLFLNNIHFLWVLRKSLRKNAPPTTLSRKPPWFFLQNHQCYSLQYATHATYASTPLTLLTMARHPSHPH